MYRIESFLLMFRKLINTQSQNFIFGILPSLLLSHSSVTGTIRNFIYISSLYSSYTSQNFLADFLLLSLYSMTTYACIRAGLTLPLTLIQVTSSVKSFCRVFLLSLVCCLIWSLWKYLYNIEILRCSI